MYFRVSENGHLLSKSEALMADETAVARKNCPQQMERSFFITPFAAHLNRLIDSVHNNNC
jgi:hypothetical protein